MNGNNSNNNGPPPCHSNNGNNLTNGAGNGNGGSYRLASDPLPPVHSLGLGGHFLGSNSVMNGGIGGGFMRGYDLRQQTEALLDVTLGGSGGGHLGQHDPLLLPLPSPESLLELAELYRDDPPVHDVEATPPEPPPLLAPLTPMEPNGNSTLDHCLAPRGQDNRNLNSQYMNRNNNAMDNNCIQGRLSMHFYFWEVIKFLQNIGLHFSCLSI